MRARVFKAVTDSLESETKTVALPASRSARQAV